MTRFQLIFTGILIALGIAGVVLFAMSKNQGGETAPNVVMWGTLDNQYVSKFITDVSLKQQSVLNITYRQKNAETFENDLIAALARGAGPDMILLPQDLMLKQMDKFYVIPFENYSERTFKDSFVEQGELFLLQEGIVGLPLSLDPIVMYWNRDLFASIDAAVPPSLWTEFFGLAPKLTKKDEKGNITQSFVAFGEMRNITNAKDIISLLVLQAGSPIVSANDQGVVSAVLDKRLPGLVPAEQAVSFFTEFSNPIKTAYSWNRALPTDRSAFIGGKLAIYFGYASELPLLRASNPNLNFDVALVPQATNSTATGGKKMTFGHMNAVTILKSSRNVAAAYTAAVALTSRESQEKWVEVSGYPPVRRDLLTKLPGDAYKATFYRSALVSNGWLDPNREATKSVFSRLVENVTSGKQRVSEAVNTANIEINNLIR